MRGTAVLAAILPLAACSPEVETIVACEPRSAATPLCGFRNPENVTLELQACAEVERGACPTSFEIVAVDPRSFATEVTTR